MEGMRMLGERPRGRPEQAQGQDRHKGGHPDCKLALQEPATAAPLRSGRAFSPGEHEVLRLVMVFRAACS